MNFRELAWDQLPSLASGLPQLTLLFTRFNIWPMNDELKDDLAEIKRDIDGIKASIRGVLLLAVTTLTFLIGTILSRVF